MNMVPSNTPRTMLGLLIVISTIALTVIASTQAQEFTSPPPPKGNPLSEAKITQQGSDPGETRYRDLLLIQQHTYCLPSTSSEC